MMGKIDMLAAKVAVAMKPAAEALDRAEALRKQAREHRRQAKGATPGAAEALIAEAAAQERQAEALEERGNNLEWQIVDLLDELWNAPKGARCVVADVARSFEAKLQRKRNEDAADVETPLFLHLRRKIARFRAGEDFAAWWHKVVENWLIDRIRGKGIETVSASTEEGLDRVESQPDPGEDTVGMATKNELLERVLRYTEEYVAAAPERQRELRAQEVDTWRRLTLDGQRNADIAAAHNVSPQVVSQRVRRVRAYLQQRLKEGGWEGSTGGESSPP